VSRFDSRKGQRRDFLSSPLHSDWLWGPTSLLSNGHRRENGRGVKLTIHLHLLPRLRISAIILLLTIRGRIQKFPDWIDNEINNNKHSLRSNTRRVMEAKLTRLTHKIAIQLHLVAESCTICSSRSKQPVRKILDTPSYVYMAWCLIKHTENFNFIGSGCLSF
jgi:hypothetical protein